jgi:hypothetical protein
MTHVMTTRRGSAPRRNRIAGARWLVLLLAAGGCDEEADPPTDEPMDTSGDTGFGDAVQDDDGVDDDDDDAATEDLPDVPVPTFTQDVLPILQASCSCHGAGAEAGVDLSDEAAFHTLVNGESSIGLPFVESGDPDASYVVLKLRGEQATVGGGGSRMPLGEPLRDDQIATIEAWITGGAPAD